MSIPLIISLVCVGVVFGALIWLVLALRKIDKS